MRRQPSFAILYHRVRRGGLLPSDHKRERAARDGSHCHFLHLWNFIDHFFHISWKSGFLFKCGWIPYVSFARNNARISFLIHLSHVASEQPAILPEDFFGRVRILPIPHHYLRATNRQLADL